MGRTFRSLPILGFPIDTVEDFKRVVEKARIDYSFDIDRNIEDFRTTLDTAILPLFTNASISLNLGGEVEKQKIVATDKSTGIFDFSLASNGLYRVSEYYSQKLADEKPDRFKVDNLPKGVVPSNYVKESYLLGTKNYFFKDTDNIEYPCIVQQKGKAAIDDNVIGAKLKFATRNKKVYLTYKKNKGKVKYVEIYSLFHWGTLSGDLQKAIRHIPILMLAEYLENIGVKTRIYMTRFVKLKNHVILRGRDSLTNMPLPQYNMGVTNSFNTPLFIQPILVKDFGDSIDKNLALSIGQESNYMIYDRIARVQLEREVIRVKDPFGNPNWKREEYYEGFERFRNKYKDYVEKGIFVSKEVLPEAMLFFYDYSINTYLNQFMNTIRNLILRNPDGSPATTDTERLLNLNINPFFNWWMRMSATHIKAKYEIINSKQLRGDLLKMKGELESLVEEINIFLENQAKDSTLIPINDDLKSFKTTILRSYYLIDRRDNFNFNGYVLGITSEITDYADGDVYPTPPEERKKRNDLLNEVIKELQNI